MSIAGTGGSRRRRSGLNRPCWTLPKVVATREKLRHSKDSCGHFLPTLTAIVLIQALEAVTITSRIGAARRCTFPLSFAYVFAATVLHIQLDSVRLIADSSIFIPFVNLLKAFLLVPLHIHKVYMFSKDYLHLISLGDLEVKLVLHVITVYCYCAPFRPFQTLLENEF